MRCPYCGAENNTELNKFCEYCGSQLVADVPKQEDRIVYKEVEEHTPAYREEREKEEYAHSSGGSEKKSKGCLWWFLMLYIWPFALSRWIYTTDSLNWSKNKRFWVIVAFWLAILIFYLVSPKEEATAAVVMAQNAIGLL